jgi:Hypothetical protein (DUF2513)
MQRIYGRGSFLGMKRDMEVARAVLAHIESGDEFNGGGGYILSAEDLGGGHSTEEVAYHVILLVEAGFIKGDLSAGDVAVISRLTWDGHEFLDDTRNPEVWAVVMRTAKRLGGVGVALLWELAKAELKKRLTLP